MAVLEIILLVVYGTRVVDYTRVRRLKFEAFILHSPIQLRVPADGRKLAPWALPLHHHCHRGKSNDDDDGGE